MPPVSTGFISLFTAAFLYGSQNIATRVAGGAFGPFLSTSLRTLLVVFVLVWFVRWKKILTKDWKWFALRSFGNILSTTGLFFAISKIPVGTALFSFYAGMILTSGILGFFLYKERLTVVKICSLGLTAIGLLLIYLFNSGIAINMYVVVSVIGGAGASLWSVFSRPISSTYSLPQLVVVDSIITSLLCAGLSFGFHESWGVIQWGMPFYAILYLGLTQVFTGQLVTKGFKVVDAQIGSIILLNDTIIGMVLVYIFFREVPAMSVIFGGICIFIASILPVVVEHRKGKKIWPHH